MGIYVTADLHLGHANIIKYCDRPFATVDEMNETIIEKWNYLVRDEDVVYVLGDMALCSRSKVETLIARLRGYKVLVMGNHDRQHGVAWWLNVGFSEVHKGPIELNAFGTTFLLSHEPQVSDHMNIHGHIHDKPAYDPDTHFCVSLERTNYSPVWLEDLATILRRAS